MYRSQAKELLGPNQVIFIERWSLYRGQKSITKELSGPNQVVLERWSSQNLIQKNLFRTQPSGLDAGQVLR